MSRPFYNHHASTRNMLRCCRTLKLHHTQPHVRSFADSRRHPANLFRPNQVGYVFTVEENYRLIILWAKSNYRLRKTSPKASSSGGTPTCMALSAMALYMAPVSTNSAPRRVATSLDVEDFPEPAGPSIAMITVVLRRFHVVLLQVIPVIRTFQSLLRLNSMNCHAVYRPLP